MRLGLIGLGRIGAFHAHTLCDLEAVNSLVVYDQARGARPSSTQSSSVGHQQNPRRASRTSWSPASMES